ncbi:MAG TPA: DUF1643 domain-containing protein [Sphingomicrobium sp.]|jgi:hypothetical protein|nr:DUF1643 domain-containing protein [Sphingomicrobium sp.]
MIERTACLSESKVYRWWLERHIDGGGKSALWIGVNPSTADGKVDDTSIRKLYGFGDRLGIKSWYVANKFAFRATDVRKVARAEDPIGWGCDMTLRLAMQQVDLVIVGWGAIGKLPPRLQNRWRDIVAMADEFNVDLHCWGVCKDGHPRHPLMLSYDTPLEKWTPPQ